SRRGRDAVAIVGAAPRALRAYVADVAPGPDGLRVTLRNGPMVQFGDATRARAKWIAISRVLGDPRAAGATYLDVRIPERPVAGRFDDPTAAPALDGAAAGEETAGTTGEEAAAGEGEAASGETAETAGETVSGEAASTHAHTDAGNAASTDGETDSGDAASTHVHTDSGDAASGEGESASGDSDAGE
ncbi:MAG TPA: hypothetical protein VNB64_13665, partial [Solirubrobacteraceae bacterium]|nr:hypothetical protein [Solirubrobacteraceae bacterium]